MTRKRVTNENQHFLINQFYYNRKTDFYQDYKDIQRTAKINVPKGTKSECRSSLASQ